MKQVILVDARNLCYRAHWSHAKLSSRGRPTSVLFGATNMLLSIHRKLKAPIVMVWDGAGETWRHKILKDRPKTYKGNRQHVAEVRNIVNSQVDILQSFLSGIGILNLEVKQLEADDLIGILSRYLSKIGLQVIIYSGDRDFYQLINDKVLVYSPQGKMASRNSLITASKVKKEWGVSPKDFAKMKAFCGDKSDNIQGVRRGLGKKTAARLVQEGLNPRHPEFSNHSNDICKRLSLYKPLWKIAHENFWLCRILTRVNDERLEPQIKDKVAKILYDIGNWGVGRDKSKLTESKYRETINFLLEYEMDEIFDRRKELWNIQ